MKTKKSLSEINSGIGSISTSAYTTLVEKSLSQENKMPGHIIQEHSLWYHEEGDRKQEYIDNDNEVQKTIDLYDLYAIQDVTQ